MLTTLILVLDFQAISSKKVKICNPRFDTLATALNMIEQKEVSMVMKLMLNANEIIGTSNSGGVRRVQGFW